MDNRLKVGGAGAVIGLAWLLAPQKNISDRSSLTPLNPPTSTYLIRKDQDTTPPSLGEVPSSLRQSVLEYNGAEHALAPVIMPAEIFGEFVKGLGARIDYEYSQMICDLMTLQLDSDIDRIKYETIRKELVSIEAEIASSLPPIGELLDRVGEVSSVPITLLDYSLFRLEQIGENLDPGAYQNQLDLLARYSISFLNNPLKITISEVDNDSALSSDWQLASERVIYNDAAFARRFKDNSVFYNELLLAEGIYPLHRARCLIVISDFLDTDTSILSQSAIGSLSQLTETMLGDRTDKFWAILDKVIRMENDSPGQLSRLDASGFVAKILDDPIIHPAIDLPDFDHFDDYIGSDLDDKVRIYRLTDPDQKFSSSANQAIGIYSDHSMTQPATIRWGDAKYGSKYGVAQCTPLVLEGLILIGESIWSMESICRSCNPNLLLALVTGGHGDQLPTGFWLGNIPKSGAVVGVVVLERVPAETRFTNKRLTERSLTLSNAAAIALLDSSFLQGSEISHTDFENILRAPLTAPKTVQMVAQVISGIHPELPDHWRSLKRFLKQDYYPSQDILKEIFVNLPESCHTDTRYLLLLEIAKRADNNDTEFLYDIASAPCDDYQYVISLSLGINLLLERDEQLRNFLESLSDVYSTAENQAESEQRIHRYSDLALFQACRDGDQRLLKQCYQRADDAGIDLKDLGTLTKGVHGDGLDVSTLDWVRLIKADWVGPKLRICSEGSDRIIPVREQRVLSAQL